MKLHYYAYYMITLIPFIHLYCAEAPSKNQTAPIVATAAIVAHDRSMKVTPFKEPESGIPFKEKDGMYNLISAEHFSLLVKGRLDHTLKKFSLKSGDTVVTIGTHELYRGANRHFSIYGENVMIAPSVQNNGLNLCFLKRGTATVACMSFDYIEDANGKLHITNKSTKTYEVKVM